MTGPVLSVVVPMYNESDGIEVLYSALQDALNTHFEKIEYVFVDDGSTDDTYSKILSLSQKDSSIVPIGLARNFGKEIALTAGLDHASGNYVVPLDADLQDPPSLIPQMVAKLEEGFDVVYGVRTSRSGESAVKKLSAWMFYKVVSRMSSVSIPENTGDFRVMRKEVIHALKLIREQNRFMKGLFAWVGFRQAPFPYVREPRAVGVTKWNYWKLWELALDGITSFSNLPLKVASYLGFIIALFSFCTGAFYALKTLIYGEVVQGFPTITVSIFFFGGLQLMFLGILGEYIGRIYSESKGRPLYIKRNSASKSESI